VRFSSGSNCIRNVSNDSVGISGVEPSSSAARAVSCKWVAMTTCHIKDLSFQGLAAPRKSTEPIVMCIAEYKFGAADSRGERMGRRGGGGG
jgi:hypothetical protein